MPLERAKSIEAELQPLAKPQAEEVSQANKSLWRKMVIVFSNITVEPVFVLYLLPCTMASLATQNLSLEKACRVNLALNQSICDGLSTRNSSQYNESHEVAVQRLVASTNAWKNVIQSVIPAILLMFLGSWSDRSKRRKPCIILPICGEAVGMAGLLVCTYFFYELPLEFNILAEALPPAITGGWFAMFMGIYSYISGISRVETRTIRIGAISTFSNVSTTVGIALSGSLYMIVGFFGIFSLSLSMYLFGIICGIIMIKEDTSKWTAERENVGWLRDFFDLKHISATFRVAFKSGDKKRRKQICVIMILVMVIIGPGYGEYTIMYLFTRYRFQWSEVDFSIFCTYAVILSTAATIFSLSFFSNYLKMDDALLGMIAGTSKVFASFVYAFAPTTTIFYLGTVVEMLNSTSSLLVRSMISKLVPADELGKVNSLFGVFEAMLPVVYGPMYSIVYKWTINTVPGAFFLLGAALTVPGIFLYFWLYTEHKRDMREAQKNKAQKEELLQNGKIKKPPIL